MGWDAYAMNKRGHKKTFAEASKRVHEQAGGAVDADLENGGLGCSDCARALADATNANCYGHPWTPAQVAEYAARAKWPKRIPKEEKWAVLSARAFLETCAAIGSGIRFDPDGTLE
jgi:predicted trehalose synthase